MHTILQPEGWAKPVGYANGVAARGRMVFVGGQVGWNAECRFETDDFVGRSALEKVARDGVARRLVGLAMRGRGIARHGYPVHRADRATGIVTSGTQSPSLGEAIAMAYVATADAEPGTMVEVEIRGQRVPAEVVALPFYRRAR